MDTEPTEDVHGEAGAVEGARPGGAVLVGRALVPCGLLQHPLSKAVGAWPGPRRRQHLDRRNRRCRLVLQQVTAVADLPLRGVREASLHGRATVVVGLD